MHFRVAYLDIITVYSCCWMKRTNESALGFRHLNQSLFPILLLFFNVTWSCETSGGWFCSCFWAPYVDRNYHQDNFDSARKRCHDYGISRLSARWVSEELDNAENRNISQNGERDLLWLYKEKVIVIGRFNNTRQHWLACWCWWNYYRVWISTFGKIAFGSSTLL